MYDSASTNLPSFIRALEEQTAALDGDIERLCSSHYQGFIDSIDRLLKLKDHALELQVCVTTALHCACVFVLLQLCFQALTKAPSLLPSCTLFHEPCV